MKKRITDQLFRIFPLKKKRVSGNQTDIMARFGNSETKDKSGFHTVFHHMASQFSTRSKTDL